MNDKKPPNADGVKGQKGSERNVKHVALVIVLATVAAIGAGVAKADPLRGDPRKQCPATTSSPRYCAQTVVLKAIRAKAATLDHVGSVIPACSPQTKAFLRWECGLSDAGGHTWQAFVTFKHTVNGWFIYTSIRQIQ